jgi:hypothetical protein
MMCESCARGDHENCIGEPTVLEGGYTTCCCNATDENVVYEDDDVIEVETTA